MIASREHRRCLLRGLGPRGGDQRSPAGSARTRAVCGGSRRKRQRSIERRGRIAVSAGSDRLWTTATFDRLARRVATRSRLPASFHAWRSTGSLTFSMIGCIRTPSVSSRAERCSVGTRRTSRRSQPSRLGPSNRAISLDWGVTGQTNPDTAAIGFRQRLADGTEINDEVRLVRDEHGAWSRVFGRDRACIEAPIERFGEDAEPR